MAVTLNASTTTGLVQSADTSGSLNIQSNGTTVLGVTSTGTSVTGTQSVSGNLSFNSGYGSSAVAYGCRAWVNFDGTTNTGGFCTIRGSGNVTTVADNGTGNYTINFTTAMPDVNYSMVNGCSATPSASGRSASASPLSVATYLVGSVRIICNDTGNATIDPDIVNISIFR